MKYKFGIILFIHLVNLTSTPEKSFPQSILHARIHGKVTDDSTDQPLQDVNVFLANTTRGAATDHIGFYSIDKIPLGNYELVVSMMGYKIETSKIRLIDSTDSEFNFRLKPTVLKAPVIEVEGTYPREWKKFLKKFQKSFLGTSRNASKTKILNPEVLDFNFNDESLTLKASAVQPLRIENKSLGYRIQTHLVDFAFRYYDNQVRYIHKSRFEPLSPKNDKQLESWDKNRLKTYQGSLRHFLAALISGRHRKEGFLVYNVSDLWRDEDEVYTKRITAEDVLSPGDMPYERKLSFPNYLKIVYTKERASNEYIHTMGLEHNVRFEKNKNKHQISWLKLERDSVTVNVSGHVYNTYAVTTYGYWAWERFGDTLPLDFINPEIQ